MMGLQEAIVEKLGHEMIAKIHPEEAIDLLLHKLQELAHALPDADKAAIITDIAAIGTSATDIAHRLEHAKL